jgi:multidrug resistance efflux pump
LAASSPERTLSVEQAEKRLAEAKRKCDRWARLAKTGVLSKAEAEGCAVEVGLASLRCANAHLAQAQDAFDHAEKDAAADAATALETAKAGVVQATADYNQTRLQVALTSLQRFRLLYAEHLVTKPQLQQMEARVTKYQSDAGGAQAPTPGK